MSHIQPLEDYTQLRLLADPRRMRILRLLMSGPATLTQLAAVLRHSPARVRHHLLALEKAGLVEPAGSRLENGHLMKFYRARAQAFLLQKMVLPQGRKPVLLFAGSDEPALDLVAAHLEKHLSLLRLPVGSLDGLIHLRQGLCHLSGSHLVDESGEYNTPFLRHLFPDRRIGLVTLLQRTQGWMLAPGNPKGLRGAEDLARPGIRLANRNAGSGTRLWIDRELRRLGIDSARVGGYGREFSTHEEAAAQVRMGAADLSLGLQSAAQAQGLDFTPLFEERYDLVYPSGDESAVRILDYIQTKAFRLSLARRIGYNPARTGQQIRFQENP